MNGRIVPMAMTPPTITAKFDKKHTRDFKKMDSITTHYSAGRPQTGLKRKNDQHQGGDATPDSPCKKRRFEDGSTATPGRSVPAKLKITMNASKTIHTAKTVTRMAQTVSTITSTVKPAQESQKKPLGHLSSKGVPAHEIANVLRCDRLELRHPGALKTLDNAPLTAQKPVPSKSLAVPKASATTTVAPKVVNSKFCRSKSTVHRTAVVGKTEEPNLARSKSAVLPKRPVVAPVEPSRTKSSVTKKPAPVSLKGKVHIKADNPVKVEAVIEIPAPAPSPKRTRSATLLQKSQENQADRETSVPTAAVVPAPKPTKTINTKQAPVAAAREKEKDNKVDTAAAGPKPVASKTLATKRAVDKLEKVKTKTVSKTGAYGAEPKQPQRRKALAVTN
ncbi:hypothetical protein BC938DRAFT_479901 [Jimgerdemannia flammicorona]|uniref:Uncharacterized protein n=1 Tax=Jimgerdemannia flammicorona TaxID=994334 RepID=A0A433QJV8_9FUNG|nr:hypothetical protein BC938DRAFT_479901 [Jimgerdemannia flammicorona]